MTSNQVGISLKDCVESKINQHKELFIKLKNLLISNWKIILHNLPPIQNKKVKLDSRDESSFEKKADLFIDFLITRLISLNDIYIAFEKCDIEDGLILLGKPEIDIKITSRSPSNIQVKNGDSVELICNVECFPKPTIAFYDMNNKQVSSTNKYRIENALHKDSGIYKCVITQTRRNDQKFFENIYFTVNVEKDEIREKLKVSLQPETIGIDIGKTAKIEAVLTNMNEREHLNLKFEWFKSDPKSNRLEFLKDNPTATSQTLVIKDFSEVDIGIYTCQVSRELTNEKVFSTNSCRVDLHQNPEFDLKIALIIGNGNYEKDRNVYQGCVHCVNDQNNIWITEMDIYDSLERLKSTYEKLGYIVLVFIDLASDDFLRVAKLFRMTCEEANRVSVLIHVIGHGYYYNHCDFLVPIDTKLSYHENNHKYHGLMNYISISNLPNLLENFKSDLNSDPNKKFYIVCFWDLCRSTWNDKYLKSENNENNDINLKLNSSIEYTILYGCMAGKSGYFTPADINESNLKKGSIFSSLIENNLKEGLTLYEIGENINKDLEKLKQKSHYDILSNIKMDSTLRKVNFWQKASQNKLYYDLIAKEYHLSEEYCKENELFDDNNELICKYYFSKDSFVNSLKLEIVFVALKKVTNLDLIFLHPINVKVVESNMLNKKVFRITNILTDEDINLSLIIQIFDGLETKDFRVDFSLPKHFKDLYEKLNSNEINDYIRNIESIDINDDNMSLSSFDSYPNEYHYEITSNDESTQ